MFYNDDFFKRMKTILRCCLDIEVYVDCERLLVGTFGKLSIHFTLNINSN